MEGLALLCAALGTAGIGAWEIYRKRVLNERLFTEYEHRVFQHLIAGIICFAFFLTVGREWDALAPQTFNIPMWSIALIVTTLCNVVIQFANVRSSRLLDASFRAPISAVAPGLVVFGALLIGEWPGHYGIIGIALVIVAVYTSAREGAPWKEYFMPLAFWLAFRSTKNLPETEKKRMRGLRWAYGGALIATPALISDGLLARHGDMILGVTIEILALALIYAVFTSKAPSHDEGEFAPLRDRLRLHKWKMVLIGTFYAIPFIALGVAFRLAPIAYVGSLKRLAILIVVFGAVWYLREKVSMLRIVCAIGATIGAILIGFDPSPAVVQDSADAYLRTIIGR